MGEKIKLKNNLNMNSRNKNEISASSNKDLHQTTQEVHHELALNRMKQTLENFETSIISDVQTKMDGMIEEIIQQIKHYELNANEFKNFAQQQHQLLWSNRLMHKTNKNDDDDDDSNSSSNSNNNNISRDTIKNNTKKQKLQQLPDKIFTPRNSYLTCLLDVTHMKSIYHIFFVILTVLFFHTIIHDYVAEGKINIGGETIKAGLGKIELAFVIWIVMQLCTFCVYLVFKLWVSIRYILRKNKFLQMSWDYLCIIIFVLYQLSFAYFTSISVVKLNLALVSSVIILLEMVRFMMKTHAFVRTNAAIQLAGKQKSDITENNKHNFQSVPVTKFSKYLYFLFAPTLIFREEYPRTKVIRWKFVIARLTEVVAGMFFQSYFYERYLIPTYQNFGKEQITPGHFLVSIFNMMMPGLMIYLSGFYILLHAWLNATAEILRFADRMFYKDWWTCKNFESFYRNWNVVIHDWLYEYIYKDFYNYIFKGSKSASVLITFFISAIAHEYILAIGLRFLFPFLFINFAIFSVMLAFVMKKYEHDFGNFILWLALGTGNGVVISFYSMEYFARQNCPINETDWMNLIIPRFLSCNGITDNSK